jgi:hypothetical protein
MVMASKKKKPAKKKAAPRRRRKVQVPGWIIKEMSSDLRRNLRKWVDSLADDRRDLFRAILTTYMNRAATGQGVRGWKVIVRIIRQEFEAEGFNFQADSVKRYASTEWPNKYDDATRRG